MSDELKPCPFCGGEAKDWEYEDEQDLFDPISLGWVDTRCVTWHCVGCESCEVVISRLSKDDAIAVWNARAAVTDDQYAVAVHDGEAWQRVRTCRFTLEEDREMLAEKAACGPGEFVTQDMPDLLWTCSACGEQYRNGLGELPGWLKHCPNCGAKVAPC